MNRSDSKHAAPGCEQVARRLVRYVADQRVGNGSRLPSIRVLARLFRTSPSTVRDALLRLQTTGLVSIHPRAGAFVQSVSYAPLVRTFQDTIGVALLQQDGNLFSLLDTRKLVEIELAGRAAAACRPEQLFPLYAAIEVMASSGRDLEQFIRADEEFHLALGRIAGNEVMVAIVGALLAILRPHRLSFARTPRHLAVVRAAHRKIYEALVKHDPEEARAQMRSHLEYRCELLRNRLTRFAEDQ
ncbi:MAG: FadR family transcriptional regulator [Verrucomicrobia bacterium]|nr:FadR family transcriptional regulator [Verrucomicrobiota bacterium]